MSVKSKNKNIRIQLNKEINALKYKNNEFFNKSSINDLTHLKTYTIDDNDTLEKDDAISLERIEDKYKVWIHIASPALHIDYDSAIDLSARKLISTIYLSTNNIYMFPIYLINEIFSLNEKNIRAAISLGVIFNNDATIDSYEILESIIKPSYHLDYYDADILIDYAPKEEKDLSIIYKILEKRKQIRIKNGAKEILESYGKVIVNDNIPSIKIIDPTLSRFLISEAMILYGDLLSDYTKKNNIPVPYRVQEGINNQNNDNKLYSKNKILNNYFLKKTMGRTYYSTQPLRHNSLGLNSYLQASSPIRRYSDLLVHYQINRFINNKNLISKEEIDNNINHINNIARQNISRYREDQKNWFNILINNNEFKEYKVILLNWINRYKKISLIYFLEYKISSICYLKTKLEIKSGDNITINNITNDYKDILYFQLIS
tara:strand:+ start:2319 stop:3614 length:1296 start_codon:yes stop_codon:yes gene_type:complete